MDKTLSISKLHEIKGYGFLGKKTIKQKNGEYGSLYEYLEHEDIGFDVNDNTIDQLERNFKSLKLNELEFKNEFQKNEWNNLFSREEEDGVEETKHSEVEPQVEVAERSPRVRLVTRLPQSGKTEFILKKKAEFISSYNECPDTIPIAWIISANNKLLNCQTCIRDNKRRGPSQEKNKTITISSDPKIKGKNYKSTKDPEVMKYLMMGEIDTLFYCGHTTRIGENGDISWLINEFSKPLRFQNEDLPMKKVAVIIFVDEADKVLTQKVYETSVREWLATTLHQSESLIVEKMYWVTATPVEISNKFQKIQNWVGKWIPEIEVGLEPFKGSSVVPDGYHRGVFDSIIECHEMPPLESVNTDEWLIELNKQINYEDFNEPKREITDVFVYIGSHLKNYDPPDGAVDLYGGKNYTNSHDLIAEMLKSINPRTGRPFYDVILKLNGKQKVIYELDELDEEDEEDEEENTWESVFYNSKTKLWTTTDCVSLGSKEKETSEWLKEFWKEKKKRGTHKMAIVTKICGERGITFSSVECNITTGIFGPYVGTKHHEVYQFVNRLSGYTRTRYNKPKFIATAETHLNMKKYEEILLNLQERALNSPEPIPLTKKILEDSLKEINKKYAPENKNISIEFFDIDKTFEDVRKFEKDLMAKKILKPGDGVGGHTNKTPDQRGFYKCNIVGDAGGNQVWSLEAAMKRCKSGISQKHDKRLIWCYKDLEDVTSKCYIFVYWNPPRED